MFLDFLSATFQFSTRMQSPAGLTAFESHYMEVETTFGQPEIPEPWPTEFDIPTDGLSFLEQLDADDDIFRDLFELTTFSSSGEYHQDPHSDPGVAVSSLNHSTDQEAQELLEELMTDDDILVLSVQPAQQSSWNATSQPNLPMIEPQQQRRQRRPQELQKKLPQKRHLLEQPPSPTAVSSCSCDGGCETSPALVSPAREAEIDEMVAYIKDVIERSSNSKPDEMSSKLKVHEVILTILLNSSYGDKSKDLRRILTFCDENGRETAGECRHFKTLDTETMGLLWQKIKGNKKATYDTFARAMRVRREKSRGYFDYLDSGKRSKKRIYRFGDKTIADMDRMKRTLRLLSVPHENYF